MSIAEILSLISLICYIIAGITFVLSFLFWFLFRIPSVIGDLSGRTARKSIARTRARNERAGGKGYQPSATNAKRGMLTTTMPTSGKMKAETKRNVVIRDIKPPDTGVLEANRAEPVTGQQTDLLENSATGILTDTGATAEGQKQQVVPVKKPSSKTLTILEEIILVHTDEVI